MGNWLGHKMMKAIEGEIGCRLSKSVAGLFNEFSIHYIVPLICIPLFFTSGCAALFNEKSYVAAFNFPKYQFDSGILKLEHTLTMPSGDRADEMFFSHNGRYLVTTSTHSLHFNIWDMETGKIKHQIDRYAPGRLKVFGRRYISGGIFSSTHQAMFLPDDSALLLPKVKKGLASSVTNITPVSEGYYPGANYSYFYLDMDNPDMMRPALPQSLVDGFSPVGSFSPDGKYFAQTGRTTKIRGQHSPSLKYGKIPFLKLYRTSDWKLVADVKKGFASRIIRFTSDSKYVVDYERVGDDDGIKPIPYILDPDNPYRKYKFFKRQYKDDYLDNLEEYEYPEIRFWSVPDLKLVKTIDNVFRGTPAVMDRYPRDFSISQDGKTVAVQGLDEEKTEAKILGSEGFVRVFSIDTGKMIFELKELIGDVDFSRNNQYLIVRSVIEKGAVTLYSTRDWQVKEQVRFRKNAKYLIHPVSFNTKRNLLAYGNGNIIYIWKIIEE